MVGVRDTFYTAAPSTQRGVVLALARNMPNFARNSYSSGLKNPLYSILVTMVDFVEQSEAHETMSLATELTDLLPEQVALQLVLDLGRESRSRAMSLSYSQKRGTLLPQIREHFVDRLEALGVHLSNALQDNYSRGLRLIAQVHGRASSEANLMLSFATGKPAVVDFLARRSATSGTVYLPNHFDRDNYAVLKEVIDPAALISVFNPLFPAPPAKDQPERDLTPSMFSGDTGFTTDREEAARQVANRIREFWIMEQSGGERSAEAESGPPHSPSPEDESTGES